MMSVLGVGRLPGRLPILSLYTRLLSGDLEVTVSPGHVPDWAGLAEQACLGQQQLQPWLSSRPGSRAKAGLAEVDLDSRPRGK